VNAEIDTLGTGQQNDSDPAGTSSAINITNANQVGANFTVIDRTPPAPVTPTNLFIAPGNTGALVEYKAPQDSITAEEIATSYKIYWGTDINASTGGGSRTFAAQGTHGSNPYILQGLTNGTTYFKISALVGATESATSSVFGPVTIGPTSGANTVSGTVTIPSGTTITGPLYVGVFNNSTGAAYSETITSPTSSQAYSVSGVPNGTYTNFATIDQNNDGEIDAGDIANVGGNRNGATITVSGTSSNNNIDLTPYAAAAAPFVVTNLQSSLAIPGGAAASYNLSLAINWGTKRPVAVTLISGPNVPVPLDMGADQNNQIQTPTFVSGAIPAVNDTYQFMVTFSDATTQTLSASVNAVLTSAQFAQTLVMSTSPSRTSPTLTWAAPATPPTATPYTYSVNLTNCSFVSCSGASENWSYSGGQNSNGIPSATTSVPFNTDGSASPSPTLTTGTTYYWSVQVTDANGNTALIYAAPYTP